MNLSEQQKEVFAKILEWYRGPEKRLVLGGYAGTGKSTLAELLQQEIGSKVFFCALTGKAANVLREKGCDNVSTIHGGIYHLIGTKDKENQENELQKKTREIEKPKFRLNLDSDFITAKLVIVDEYSMLSEQIINDLETLSKKVLYLGDPFQLPPVNGECFLQPELFLTEVHRQALDSPIIRAATAVRNGEVLDFCNEEGFVYDTRSNIDPAIYLEVDQLIVGRNDTRRKWNERIRERKGFFNKLPMSGEKIICLKNNKENGLFNGMIDYCRGDARFVDYEREKYKLNFADLDNIEAWVGPIIGQTQTEEKRLKFLDRFDYAHAITCHKSQGSEFKSVLVYREMIGRTTEERNRWLYTALTRGKEKVYLVEPK